MYKGYCFNDNGNYAPPVSLPDIPAIFNYIDLHKKVFPRVIAVDIGDSIVAEAVNGKIIFPVSE